MVTLCLAVGARLAANGFLSACALKAWKQDQLSAHQAHLRLLEQQHLEVDRKAAILKRAAELTACARELDLQPCHWALYDVNAQPALNFESAQEIVSAQIIDLDGELRYRVR